MTPAVDYKTLNWGAAFGRGAPEKAMLAMECDVAQKILNALNDHPQAYQIRASIQAVPYKDFPSPQRTEALRDALWRVTGAAQWIGARNATSPRCLLWQFALVRLSAYLNTGHWIATQESAL